MSFANRIIKGSCLSPLCEYGIVSEIILSKDLEFWERLKPIATEEVVDCDEVMYLNRAYHVTLWDKKKRFYTNVLVYTMENWDMAGDYYHITINGIRVMCQ